MEENTNKNEKDLALEKKVAEEILQQIYIAILNDKEEIYLDDGATFIPIKLLKDDEEQGISIEFGGEVITKIRRKENPEQSMEALRRAIRRNEQTFNFKKIHDLNLDRQVTAKEQTNLESLKLESELKTAISEGRVTQLRTGRELTKGEDLSLMFNRMFGTRTHEVYRVKDKENPHKFKYICKDNSGDYVEPKGNNSREGNNPQQKCWVQDTDGKMVKKTVDHIQVFGRYALATDVPDNVVNEHTRTLVGVRCPGEGYVFMPALDNKIINTPQNDIMKENLTRANTILEIEDIALAAQLGERIYGITKDSKLSVEEVEFIKQLKEEGVSDEKIRKIVDVIVVVMEMKIQGLNDTHIKAILDSVDTVAEQIKELEEGEYDKDEIKQALDMIYEQDMKIEDVKDILDADEKKRDEDRFPERGRRRIGPWNH